MSTLIRIFTLLIPVAAVTGLFTNRALATSGTNFKTLTGVIVEVTSGDSVLLRTDDNREIPLYLWGIDSPEINNRTGQRARKLTIRLVQGERVEVKVKARTSDGRFLCRITFDGKKDLAEELLKEGYAVWVTRLAPEETAYEAAQTIAQDKRKGLWKQWLPRIGI